MMVSAETKETRWPLALAATLALGVAGSCSSVLLPALIGSFAHLAQLTGAQAAIVASIEMAAMTVSAAIVALSLRWIGVRRFAVGALIGFAVANLVSGLATTMPSLALVRATSGLSEGTLMATMSAALAGGRSPARAFALSMALNLSVSALGFDLLPKLVESCGPAALYYGLAVLAVPGLLLSPWLCAARADRAGEEAGATSGPDNLAPIVVALFAALALFTAAGAVWAVVGRVGLELGLTEGRVGAVLGGATLAGIVAGLGASWIGGRLSRPTILALSTLLLAAAMIGFPLLRTSGAFPFLTDAMMGCYVLAAPFYLGVVARLDPTGKLAAAFIAVQYAGFAIGPALAAPFLNSGVYGVFWVGTGLCGIALPLILLADAK